MPITIPLLKELNTGEIEKKKAAMRNEIFFLHLQISISIKHYHE